MDSRDENGEVIGSAVVFVRNVFVTHIYVICNFVSSLYRLIVPLYKNRLQQPSWDDLGKFHNTSPTRICLAGQFSSYGPQFEGPIPVSDVAMKLAQMDDVHKFWVLL